MSILVFKSKYTFLNNHFVGFLEPLFTAKTFIVIWLVVIKPWCNEEKVLYVLPFPPNQL